MHGEETWRGRQAAEAKSRHAAGMQMPRRRKLQQLRRRKAKQQPRDEEMESLRLTHELIMQTL